MNTLTTRMLLSLLLMGAGVALAGDVAGGPPKAGLTAGDAVAPADVPAARIVEPPVMKGPEEPVAACPAGPAVEADPAAVTQTNVVAPRLMGEKGLRLNFRGVPLEMVLNYMSEAAGFTIILEAELKGKVDVWSNRLLDREEAVDLLNTILNQNGYAAIRNGRTLTIVGRDDAKKRNIPVQSGNDPSIIRKTDEMVTQVIPIKYANATQLTKDLQPLLPAYATLTANESGNALVLTDTQSDVRRMVEIVNALDTSISSVLTLKVFALHNSDPVEMADMLNQLFPDDSKTGSEPQNPFAGFRFGRGGGAGAPAGGGAASSGGNSDRLKKKGKVLAVADQRTASVIICAASELMPQIAEMLTQLDGNTAKKQKVYVYTLENADVEDVEPILQDMFEKSGTSSARRTTTSQRAGTTANRNTQNQRGTAGRTSSGIGGGSTPFSR